jgi:hypothetical protein
MISFDVVTEHKAKLAPGFTKAYGITLLVYYEEYSSMRPERGKQVSNAGDEPGKLT